MATIILGSLTAAAVYKLIQRLFPPFKERENAIKFHEVLQSSVVTVEPSIDPFVPSEEINPALNQLNDHVFRLRQPGIWSKQKQRNILFVSGECPEKMVLFIRRCAQVTPLLKLKAPECEDPNERLKYFAAGFTKAKDFGECVILVEDCDDHFSSETPVIYNRRILRQFLDIFDSLGKNHRRIFVLAMSNGKTTLQKWFVNRVPLELKYEKDA